MATSGRTWARIERAAALYGLHCPVLELHGSPSFFTNAERVVTWNSLSIPTSVFRSQQASKSDCLYPSLGHTEGMWTSERRDDSCPCENTALSRHCLSASFCFCSGGAGSTNMTRVCTQFAEEFVAPNPSPRAAFDKRMKCITNFLSYGDFQIRTKGPKIMHPVAAPLRPEVQHACLPTKTTK